MRGNRDVWFLIILVLVCIALHIALISVAFGQHNHAQGHADYQGWSSTKTGNCCDNRDCGVIADSDIREINTGRQIKINGEWCPILREHYIIRGKSPDWNVFHACINRNINWTGDPCQRLLCFSGKGGF